MPPDERPGRLVLFSGTGTGVGKTWSAAAALGVLRAGGVVVAARKPVQSFSSPSEPTDAHVLSMATGEAPELVCPPRRWYERALAPPMAAEALGRPPFTISDLVSETVWAPSTAVGVVEGVGGPRSPLAVDGDTAALAAALAPDLVVIVADAGLGAVNGVRLCGTAFGAVPLVVALNRFDPNVEVHARNRAWLQQRDGFDVVVETLELAGRMAGDHS